MLTFIQTGIDIMLLADGVVMPKNFEYGSMPGLTESMEGRAITEGVGVRVIVHPSTKPPFPYSQGWDISPTKMTSISLKVGNGNNPFLTLMS